MCCDWKCIEFLGFGVGFVWVERWAVFGSEGGGEMTARSGGEMGREIGDRER